jgi:hypothetical protein
VHGGAVNTAVLNPPNLNGFGAAANNYLQYSKFPTLPSLRASNQVVGGSNPPSTGTIDLTCDAHAIIIFTCLK